MSGFRLNRALVVTFTLVILFLIAGAESARAQSGVLIPAGRERPDPSVLTMDEMIVSVRIDNQFARVRVVQIFGNRTERIQEGRYVFLIPTTASISDFAVWDGDVRIPGVILEKRRAEEIYTDLALQAIDPGLLSQESEDGAATAFTVQVVPIPAYGTKRLELEYSELLRVENLESYFSFPFKPGEYGVQQVGRLEIKLQMMSRFPMSALNFRSSAYPIELIDDSSTYKTGSFVGTGVSLTEDLAFSYGLAAPRSSLEFLAYRAPERISAHELRDPRMAERDPDGYFEAAALFNEGGRAPGEAEPPLPRSVLLMLDTSLSMQWEKLDRAFEAIEGTLRSLTPGDTFSLILFNDEVAVFNDRMIGATAAEIDRALQFIKSSHLSGGTDLGLALERAARLARRMPGRSQKAIVIISDGNPTLSTTRARTIVERFTRANESGPRARVFAFGIGSDTNIRLLGDLARASRGYFDWSRETDDLSFRLNAFVGKVGREPIDSVALSGLDASNLHHVYPGEPVTAYDGTRISFVGRYRRPGVADLAVTGNSGGKPVRLSGRVELPEHDDSHPHVPRLWARARVDALLNQIAVSGETREAIDEIIALSKKYKFVTPYTSFLAAPRSLLRPRVIRPGDPVLRVRTDPSIKEVTAIFPFGLVKRLVYISDEDVWTTRFLAPREMRDGIYHCRLVLVDDRGRAHQESKSFVIDSRPPKLDVSLSHGVITAGEQLVITVRADSDTRRIAARIYGGLPVPIVWDSRAKANVGYLRVPPGLPSGSYTIRVTAEDFAHNSSATEVTIEVFGGG